MSSKKPGLIEKLNYLMDKKIKRKILFVSFLIFFGSFAELLGVAVIYPIVNLIMDENYAENVWCKIIMSVTGITDREPIILIVIGLAVGIYIFKSVYLSWMYSQLYKTSAFVKESISVKLIKSYMRQPYAFFLSKNTSELIRSVNNDTSQLYEATLYMFRLIADGLIALFLLITLAVTNLVMTLVVAALLGFCAAIILLFIKKKSRYYGKRNQELTGSLLKSLQQMFGGVKEIKIMNSEQFFIKGYVRDFKECTDVNRKFGLTTMIPKYLIEAVCMCGILAYLTFEIFNNPYYMDIVPGIAVFVAAAYKLLPSVNSIFTYLNFVIFHKASIDLVYDDIKEANELAIQENADSCDIKPMTFDHDIVLNHVSFAYDNTERMVLEDVNIKIPKGKSVAFVGPSGGGKTTLADIVIGLLRPVSGKVLVDGKDIIENIEGWRKQIGYIPQNIFLVDDSLKNNVAWGVNEASTDENKVWQALADAQIADFVRESEKGLEMDVGERGTRISGGQRQRLGIARALYRNPQVLVFDEATSALDNETEKEVMKAIESLQGTRTMIMIAHRLTTVEKCDIIFRVENGKVEQITHDELFEHGGN